MRMRILLLASFLWGSGVSLYAQSSYSSPETGERVLGTYFATDIDTVDLKNGNLHVNVPVFSLAGRELPLRLAMDYNSQFLEGRTFYNEFGQLQFVSEFLGWRKDTGIAATFERTRTENSSWNVAITIDGVFYNCASDYNLDFYWVDPKGTKYRFTKFNVTQYWQCNNPSQRSPSEAALWDNITLESASSEFIRLTTGNFYSGGPIPAAITFKDGVKILLPSSGVAELRSRNGNRLVGNSTTQTVTPYNRGLNDYLPLTDTVGRTISYSTAGDTQTITLTASDGSPQVYGLNFVSVTRPMPSDWGTGTITLKMLGSIDLPNGRNYTFTYDGNAYLQKLTFPSGAYIRYAYGSSDPNGACRVANRYVSADGTAASEKTWTYVYATDGLTTTVTDPDSKQTIQTFDDGSLKTTVTRPGVDTVEKTWSGGSNNRVLKRRTILGGSSRFRETSYQYDGYNNVTREDEYDWGVSTRGPLLRYTTRDYMTGQSYLDAHTLNLVTQEKTWNAAGSTIVAQASWEYDNYSAQPLVNRTGTIPGWISPVSARANATKITRWLWTGTQWVGHDTSQQYDVLGNLVNVTDPGGHTTQTDYTDRFYDNVNRNSYAYATRLLQPATVAGQFYVDTTYDFNTGLVRRTTDALNRTTERTYDIVNRLLQETRPNTGWTRYTYDDVTPKTTKEILVDSVGNVGRVITTFDKMYRVIKTETFDPGGNIFVDIQYDNKGRKWKVSNPYRTGEAVLWTEYQYDAGDRPVKTIAPDGSAVQYAYVLNQTIVTDEAQNQRRYTYDALGRMTKVEEPNPSLETPLITTYAYNELDKLIQSTQGSQVRIFAFDSRGRMTSQTLPESGTTNFTYNNDDLSVTKTDARGLTTTSTYNSVHNLMGRTYSDITPAVSFQYDFANRRSQMTDGLGSVSYQYDTMDRLTQESRTLTGITGTFTTLYDYNIKGDLTQMTYPSGRVVNFNYATGGGCCNSRLASVVDQTTSTSIATGLAYNAAGETTSRTLGNGVVETFGYNNRLQQTTIAATLTGTPLMNFNYDYGTSTTNTGRVLARTDALQPEHSVKYFYDSIYRLGEVVSTDATTGWGIAWTFDAWGNRLTQTPQGLATGKVGTQTLGYNNNRVTTNTYDAAGNQTNDGLHNYTFNAENQITQMDGGTAVYAYDGKSRRMKKTVGSETTYYFYSVGGLLCEFTTTNTGAAQASSTNGTTYRTSDKLGTAVLLIAASGTVLENNRTLPYGESWLSQVGSANNNKFTTYERDQESGLDYARNRYNSNTNGRFMSVDKGNARLFMPVTLNRYTYGAADPINHLDTDGNMIQCPRNDGCIPLPPSPGDDPLLDLAMGPGPSGTVETIPEQRAREEQRQYLMAWGATFAGVRSAMLLLLNKNFSSDCEKFLGGKGIQLSAMKDRFLTTTLSTGENTYVWETFKPDQRESQKRVYGNKTVAEWMKETKRDAAAVISGNEIFFNIWGNIMSNDDDTNAGIFMHELAHNMGGDDYEIPSPAEMTENCVKK